MSGPHALPSLCSLKSLDCAGDLGSEGAPTPLILMLFQLAYYSHTCPVSTCYAPLALLRPFIQPPLFHSPSHLPLRRTSPSYYYYDSMS